MTNVSDSSSMRKAYKNLAVSVLKANYIDASSIYKKDSLRFLNSRRCSDFCDLAGIDSKEYRRIVREEACKR